MEQDERRMRPLEQFMTGPCTSHCFADGSAQVADRASIASAEANVFHTTLVGP